MRGYWYFETRWGIYSIQQTPDGRWHPVFDGESLGSYHHPAAALDDLVGGHTFTPSNRVDTSKVGLPDDLSEWVFMRTG